MPDAKEAGLRNVHRGMSGEVIAGTDENGTRVKFPQPSSLPARPTVPAPSAAGATAAGAKNDINTAGGAVPGAAPAAAPAPAESTVSGFPKSGMRTGNPTVNFQSAQERSAAMVAASKQEFFRQGVAATEKRRQADQVAANQVDVKPIPQANGRPGAIMTDRQTTEPKIAGVYGTASASFPKPGGSGASGPVATPAPSPGSGPTAAAPAAFPKPKKPVAAAY